MIYALFVKKKRNQCCMPFEIVIGLGLYGCNWELVT